MELSSSAIFHLLGHSEMKSEDDILDFNASNYLFKGCSKINEEDILVTQSVCPIFLINLDI